MHTAYDNAQQVVEILRRAVTNVQLAGYTYEAAVVETARAYHVDPGKLFAILPR